MKLFVPINNLKILLSILVSCTLWPLISAQQSCNLFFMNSIPESNFVNPAVQLDCGLFVGIPIISSIHASIGSNAFNAFEASSIDPAGTFKFRPDIRQEDLSNHNFLLSEAHVVLLALGMRHRQNYLTFSITEKNNQAALYTEDLGTFYLSGNRSFLNQWMELNPSGIFSNHFREYAFGFSRSFSSKLILGMKAKLLFGKLNIESDHSEFHMYTQESPAEIIVESNAGINSSMPYSINLDSPEDFGLYNKYNTSLGSILMNRGNPGMALDFGFNYNYSSNLSFSGSVIDLGFIRYRSDLTNYDLKGQYYYEGAWALDPGNDSLLSDFAIQLNENMDSNLSQEPYDHVLDPRVYLGASYKINSSYKLNLLLYNRFFTNRIQTGATVAVQSQLSSALNASLSWSYMNRSFANFGIGIDYRKDPVQVYLVSDNMLGVLMPNTFNNANIRIGVNLFFGCRNKNLLQDGWGPKEYGKYQDLKSRKNLPEL